MTDLVLHKAEKYIQEDLDYYFSSQRDMHNHVRPGNDLYSLTPDSDHINVSLDDGKIGNLFYPFAPFSLERIYIGISFPLFANNWGTSFLRYLLTRIKPSGCIILPVYPEMQAIEKNYWSRSLLENIFLSRTRWLGISNIHAENDGVMSIRVGRKWPPNIVSCAKYLFSQNSNILLREEVDSRSNKKSLHDNFLKLHKPHWQNVTISAVTEKIIHDYFGMKKEVQLCDISDNHGLSAIECLLSSYISVGSAVCYDKGIDPLLDTRSISDHFNHKIKDRFVVKQNIDSSLDRSDSYDVICITNILTDMNDSDQKKILQKSWQKLSPNGVLIIYENTDEQNGGTNSDNLETTLNSFGTISYYSDEVASKFIEGEEISHYSSIIEQELKQEMENKFHTFRVVQKP
ncbi:MAG: hypothetical protein AB8D52_12035 [Gammaproteobacteria bacterium]